MVPATVAHDPRRPFRAPAHPQAMIPALDLSALHAHVDLPVDYFRELDALAGPESNNNPKAIGNAGERSKYQMTLTVWREECSLPWSDALDDKKARLIAYRHLLTLTRKLLRRGYSVTPYSLALAWNPHGGTDRAQRVENLYFDR